VELPLDRLASDADRTVLVLAHDDPLAVGVANPGVDYLCAGCSRVILQGVYARQFLGVVIRCQRCGALSGTPTREPGEPIPHATVVAPVGKYLLGSQLHLPGPGMFAARDAAEDYAFEVGAPYSERARAHMAGFPGGISPASLRELAAMGRSLLGDRFERFDSVYERSRKHSTPPADGHRLVELIRYGEKAANQIQSAGRRGQVALDGNRISELYVSMAMFHRWRNHPAWPHLVASLADPSHVQHTVVLMCLGSVLADAGNGVGIVREPVAGERIPDAWVAVDSHRRFDIEVKTPQALREPGSLPSQAAMVRTIERQVMRAGSASSGQIHSGRPGVIGLGAFHLGPGGIDLIDQAAQAVLHRRGQRRSHIAGIVALEVTYQTTQILGRSGSPIATTMTPVLQHRITLNPDYAMDIRISTETPPWQSMPENPAHVGPS
jgi:hypothetical protein